MTSIGDGCHAFLQPDGGWGWSNAGLVVGQGEALLVDTFFDLPLTAELLDACATASGGLPISTLVNTHHNGDHCHGNQLVDGATIVGHAKCRDYMVAAGAPTRFVTLASAPEDDGRVSYMKRWLAPFDFNGIQPVPPTTVFDEQLTVSVGGREVRLLYFGPAHTMGDIAVFVPDTRTLYAGDLLFYGSTPLIWEGSLTNWLSVLDGLAALGPEVVVPGHGPATDAGALRSMRGYVERVIEQGREFKVQGLDPAEAARRFDPGPYRDWKDGERIVLNFLRLWAELDGADPETPVDTVTGFAVMAELAAGRS